MTLESATGDLGQTFYLLHPPGLSMRDADGVPETVNKANPATAFALGAVLEVTGNTIAGEVWAAANLALGVLNASKRYGHAVAASGGGSPTVSIIRHPRAVIPTYRGPVITAKPGVSTPFLTPPPVDRLGLYGPPITVTKPAGEPWGNQFPCYYWEDGVGGSGYTIFTGVAAGNLRARYVGVTFSGGAAATSGTYRVPQGADYQLSQGQNHRVPESALSLAIPITYGAPTLSSSLYVNTARTAVVGASTSAAGPSSMGYLASYDTSVSPTAYTYFPGENLGWPTSAEAYVAWGQHCAGFIQCYPQPWIDQNGLGGAASSLPSEWSCVLSRHDSAITRFSRTALMAPRIICSDRPAVDLALNIDLPSPWSLLRVVFAAGLDVGAADIRLIAMPCRRTDPATAPLTGMTRNAVARPADVQGNHALSLQGRYAVSGGGSTFLYGASESTVVDTYLSGHADMPHVGQRFLMEDSLTNALTTENRARIGEVPSNIRVYWIDSGLGTVQWRWARWDYSTGAAAAVTAYANALGGGAGPYYADITPPPLTTGAVEKLFIQVTNDPVGDQSWWIETHDGEGYGCYPYDVPQAQLADDADSSWVGHCGWRWPQPVITAPTWGAASVASYNSGTSVLTIAVNSTATRAVDAHVGAIVNQVSTRSVRALSASYHRMLLLSVGTVSFSPWLENWDGSSWTFNGTQAKIANPTASAMTLELDVQYCAYAPSSYGRLIFGRVDKATVTLP